MIYKSLYGNNFFGYVLDLLGFGVAVAGCFLKDKHWITSSLSRSCQVRCQIDEDAEPTMRKRSIVFAHVEHWSRRPGADRCEDDNRQMFPTAVTVTPPDDVIRE